MMRPLSRHCGTSDNQNPAGQNYQACYSSNLQRQQPHAETVDAGCSRSLSPAAGLANTALCSQKTAGKLHGKAVCTANGLPARWQTRLAKQHQQAATAIAAGMLLQVLPGSAARSLQGWFMQQQQHPAATQSSRATTAAEAPRWRCSNPANQQHSVAVQAHWHCQP